MSGKIRFNKIITHHYISIKTDFNELCVHRRLEITEHVDRVSVQPVHGVLGGDVWTAGHHQVPPPPCLPLSPHLLREVARLESSAGWCRRLLVRSSHRPVETECFPHTPPFSSAPPSDRRPGLRTRLRLWRLVRSASEQEERLGEREQVGGARLVLEHCHTAAARHTPIVVLIPHCTVERARLLRNWPRRAAHPSRSTAHSGALAHPAQQRFLSP